MHYDENDRILQRSIAAPAKWAGNVFKNLIKAKIAFLIKKIALMAITLIIKIIGALTVVVGSTTTLLIILVAAVVVFSVIFIGNPFTMQSEALAAREEGTYKGKAMAIYLDVDEEGWDEEADQKVIELFRSYENKCLEGLTLFERMQAKQYALPFELIMSIENAEITLWDKQMSELRGLERWEPAPEETYQGLKTEYKWIDSKVTYNTKFVYSYSYSYYYDEYVPSVVDPVTGDVIEEGYWTTVFVSESEKDVPVEEEFNFEVRLLKEANTFDNIYVFEYEDYITTENLAEGTKTYSYEGMRRYSTANGETKNLKFTGYCADTSGPYLPPPENSGPFANTQYEVGNGSLANPFIVTANPAFFPPETLLYIEGKGYAIAKEVPDLSLSDGIGILLSKEESENFGQQYLDVQIIGNENNTDIKSDHDPFGGLLLEAGVAEQIDSKARAIRDSIRDGFHPGAYDIVFNFTYEIVKATKTYRPVASIVATDKPFRRLKEYVEERFGQEIDSTSIELLLSGALNANPNFAFHYSASMGDVYLSGYNLDIVYSNSFNSPLVWPIPLQFEQRISSLFGYRIDPVYGGASFHGGIDIARGWSAPPDALLGKPVVAAMDGVIIYSGWNGGFGNCVIIDHGLNENLNKNVRTLYGHLDTLAHRGSRIEVNAGDMIGTVGSTGKSTGPHLHFEIHIDGQKVNPLNFYPVSLCNSLK